MAHMLVQTMVIENDVLSGLSNNQGRVIREGNLQEFEPYPALASSTLASSSLQR